MFKAKVKGDVSQIFSASETFWHQWNQNPKLKATDDQVSYSTTFHDFVFYSYVQ
jgi:hypothetical protein